MSFTYVGEWALRLNLVLAALGLAVGAFGLAAGRPRWLEIQRRTVFSCAALSCTAAAVLVLAFCLNDFSLKYVAGHSSRQLPIGYTLAALWAGQEGSQLFWLALLAIYTVSYLQVYRRDAADPHYHATAFVLLAVQFFFLVIVNAPSDPFVRNVPAPDDGAGLNPLLQHPAMAIHPPMLYAGFIGMTIPFAAAMGALISGRLDSGWIRRCRVWTIFSWTILSIGIMLGGLWAYEELGWGGYWAWDPVENSSFIPWLTATAFLHSVMLQERRGMLKIWNMMLILLTFVLTIAGTYLTRSGVISSVHTFARQPALGYLFLGFILLTLTAGFGLILYRREELRSHNRIESFLSREAAFLFNNVVLLALAFAIFFGTIFPSIAELATGARTSVGPIFFNQVTSPLFFILLALTGVGPTIGWHRTSARALARNFGPPLAGAALLAAALIAIGIDQPRAIIGLSCVVFVFGCLLLEFRRDAMARARSTGEGFWMALVRMTLLARRRYGGYIIHAGVSLTALGIIVSSTFQTETEVTLAQDRPARVGRFEVRLEGLNGGRRQNMEFVQAHIAVFDGSRRAADIRSEKRFYEKSEQPQSEVGIWHRLSSDFYVVLAGWDQKSATLKIFINPLVGLVWLGGLVLLAGAAVCLWPVKARPQ